MSTITQTTKNKKQYHIVVDQENRGNLRKIGKFGESYNDILTRVLKKELLSLKQLETSPTK